MHHTGIAAAEEQLGRNVGQRTNVLVFGLTKVVVYLHHAEGSFWKNFSSVQLLNGNARGVLKVSFEYLRNLQKRSGLTVREVARRSLVLADALHQPRLAFQHQAMSGWLNGKRKPTTEHRRALALIFQVSLEELSRGMDEPLDPNSAGAVLKPVVVHVRGNKQSFRHNATLPSSLDLTRPAVYRRWTDLFRPWPAALVRHFREINHDMFGWIPDECAGPLITHPRSLVAVNTSAAHLEEAEAVQKRIWFIYVPGGNLDVGIAHREGRSLVLSKFNHDHCPLTKKYPLSRIDIVGHVTGKVLFHLDVL